MSFLIVTYDLRDPAREDAVLTYIKKRREHAKLCDSSYLIETSKTPTEIKDGLVKEAKQKITCFVCPVNKPWDAFDIPKDAQDMLNKHLK